MKRTSHAQLAMLIASVTTTLVEREGLTQLEVFNTLVSSDGIEAAIDAHKHLPVDQQSHIIQAALLNVLSDTNDRFVVEMLACTYFIAGANPDAVVEALRKVLFTDSIRQLTETLQHAMFDGTL